MSKRIWLISPRLQHIEIVYPGEGRHTQAGNVVVVELTVDQGSTQVIKIFGQG